MKCWTKSTSACQLVTKQAYFLDLKLGKKWIYREQLAVLTALVRLRDCLLPAALFSSCPAATKYLTTSSGIPPLLHQNCFKHSLSPPEFQRTPWRHPGLLTEQGWRQKALLSQHREETGAPGRGL